MTEFVIGFAVGSLFAIAVLIGMVAAYLNGIAASLREIVRRISERIK